MEIKVIFFDIDGTLVSFETHAIPQSTIDAIMLLRQKGIKLIIATGRALVDINNLGDLEFAVQLGGELLEDRGDRLAGAAPRGPEVDEHGRARGIDGRLETLGGELSDLVGHVGQRIRNE